MFYYFDYVTIINNNAEALISWSSFEIGTS